MKVTRRFRFSACHYLVNRNWTEDKNKEVFGKSVNPHGHNFEVFVTVEGEVNPETGMVINLEKLKEIVAPVVDRLDHKCLNDLDEFKEKLPTLENIAMYIFSEASKKLPGISSVLVKTGEDEFAVCTRDDVLSGFTHRISASHRLPEERVKSSDVYGICGKEKHGHDYSITIWLKGRADFQKIRELLNELNFKDLDAVLPFSTSEYLALHIAKILGEEFQVKKIEVMETENNRVTYEL